jgi:hypothetical protein
MIKPEFWTDEKVGRLSISARLLFIGMWNFADDSGVCRSNIILLKSQIFPYDEITAEDIKNNLKELILNGLVREVVHSDEAFIYINNFLKHQNISRPSNHKYIDNIDVCLKNNETLTEHSLSTHVPLTEHSLSTHVPLTEHSVSTQCVNLNLNLNQNQDIVDGSAAPVAKSARSSADVDSIFEIYKAKNKKLPGTTALNDTRRKKIKARLNGDQDFKKRFGEAVGKCQDSAFLCGDNARGWKANFDWLIANDTNYVRVLEGQYTTERKSEVSAVPNGTAKADQLKKEFEVLVDKYQRRKRSGEYPRQIVADLARNYNRDLINDLTVLFDTDFKADLSPPGGAYAGTMSAH